MRLALAILLALPVFGAAQELWHFGSPNLIYGIYRKKWHDAVYFDEVRIGHIDTTVKDTQWNGIPCKLYTSNSFFSPKEGMPAIPTARITKSYIGADGKVLRVETSYSDWQKSVIVSPTSRSTRSNCSSATRTGSAGARSTPPVGRTPSVTRFSRSSPKWKRTARTSSFS